MTVVIQVSMCRIVVVVYDMRQRRRMSTLWGDMHIFVVRKFELPNLDSEKIYAAAC